VRDYLSIAVLYDKARIFVQGGGGGNGCLSFRREAHVPRGGPDGGDGGRGGEVVLVCDDSQRDLQTFKRRAHYKAGRAGHGQGALRHGADGEDLVVRVPPGTQISLPDGTAYDLVTPGQRVVVARGGQGGRGNKHFATPTRQAPRFAERGLPGFEGWIEMRLKLLADVGLIGVPNAGKSSLLDRMTRAAPKIGNYPFTTLEPVLGRSTARSRQLGAGRHPGLIVGAARATASATSFLAHVERTRMLVHVLEPRCRSTADRPRGHLATIEDELRAYDARLAPRCRGSSRSRRRLVPAADADAGARGVAAARGRRRPRAGDRAPATGQGRDELSPSGCAASPRRPGAPVRRSCPTRTRSPSTRPSARRPDRGFEVERTGAHSFRVTGTRVERLLARFDVENEEAAAHVEHRLNRMGVITALEQHGFEPGDEVEIGGVELELDPGG
jgi:GTP-binding protein